MDNSAAENQCDLFAANIKRRSRFKALSRKGTVPFSDSFSSASHLRKPAIREGSALDSTCCTLA
jgi:hypothetical protein